MQLRLSKKIRRISVFSPDKGQAVTLYKAKKKKKKRVSRTLKPLERAVCRFGKANREYVKVYLRRHDKSRRKKRDGWLRDFSYNSYRAIRKQGKILKIPRWFRL